MGRVMHRAQCRLIEALAFVIDPVVCTGVVQICTVMVPISLPLSSQRRSPRGLPMAFHVLISSWPPNCSMSIKTTASNGSQTKRVSGRRFCFPEGTQ